MKFLIILYLCVKCSLCTFEVPDALVEVFRPRGLRVSIPQHQCLWKVKSPQYRDKHARKRAMNALVAKFKQVHNEANDDFVKKKMNNFRTCYKRELKLVKNSHKSGSEEIYKPTLWYFNLLTFLDDEDVSACSTSHVKFDDDETLDHKSIFADSIHSPLDENTESTQSSLVDIRTQNHCSKKSRRDIDQIGDPLDFVLNTSIESNQRTRDRFDVLAENMAMKLRDLPSNQRIMAEKLINDVLFEAECDNLNRNWKLANQEGIKLFAFHGKVNEEMNGREGGTFSRDVTKPKNNRWTFYDPTAELKVGDVLYYWTYVDYFDGVNKLGYTNDDQSFVIKELLEKETQSPTIPSIPNRQAPVTSAPVQEGTTLSSSCKETATTVNNRKVCAETEIFSDDFSSFNRNKWRPEIKFAGGPDYEFVLYGNEDKNLEVKKGQLKISPLPSNEVYGEGFATKDHEFNLGVNCTGVHGTTDCVQKPDAFLILPPTTSAQISTKDKFSFKYGKVEIKAKLPKGDWVYPQLFLNPQNEDYGPGYASGQIRIAFLPGNSVSLSNLQGGCILGGNQAGRSYAMKEIKKNTGGWNDDFHKFTLIWKPDQIIVAVNDHVYGNIYPPEGGFISEARNLNLGNMDRWRTGSRLAPFDKEMYLTVGVGVGGHVFEDTSDGTKPWRNFEPKAQKKFYQATSQWRPSWTESCALKVDYIKVWSL